MQSRTGLKEKSLEGSYSNPTGVYDVVHSCMTISTLVMWSSTAGNSYQGFIVIHMKAASMKS